MTDEARQCLHFMQGPWHALVARPNTGIGADRSVVLVKHQGHVRYQQGIKCWRDDHQLRAQTYAGLINQGKK